MITKHISRADLAGKTIDIHTHAGIQIREAAQISFPYCSSIEDLSYRQRANGVDVAVVFPISPAFYYDLPTHVESGKLVPPANGKPISAAPYERENRLLLTDVYRFCPEHSHRFLPFISVVPGRNVPEQIAVLQELEREFPIYGVKISPILAQSKALELLGPGEAFLEFFAERNWPILFHASLDPTDEYSQMDDIMKVIERHSELRYCLAHSLGCQKYYLDWSKEQPNVWVDTSALKIQVELFGEAHRKSPAGMLDLDYDDHCKVMQGLVATYPKTIIWGSDSPYHSYITRRLQGEGVYREFRLKGTYEQEKEALDSLTPAQREQNHANGVQFIFGNAA